MTRTPPVSLAALLAAFSLALVLTVPPVHAQGCEGETAPYEQRLRAFIDDFYRVSASLEKLDPTGAAIVRASAADLQRAARDLPPESARQLCRFFDAHPEALWASRDLASELATLPAAKFSGEGVPGCLTLTRDQYLTQFIITEVVRGIGVIAEVVCESTECISVVCKASCLLAALPKAAVVVLEGILERSAYCAFADHDEEVNAFISQSDGALNRITTTLGDPILERVDQPLSSRVSATSLSEIEDLSVSELIAARSFAQDLRDELEDQGIVEAKRRDTTIHRRIEASLQDGQEGRISTFQLPASVGGLLEEVREVVAATIVANVDAGRDVGSALDRFDQADRAFNFEFYKAAFGLYRQAYREAVGEP